MNRRTLLKAIPVSLATAVGLRLRGSSEQAYGVFRYWLDRRLRSVPHSDRLDPVRDEGAMSAASRLDKIRDFDRTYDDDHLLDESGFQVLRSTAARVERTQRLVGHGNFNLLSFDQLLSFASNYPEIGEFTAAELAFLDEIFHTDARRYGFFGEKVVEEQTAVIDRRTVIKIPGSGHFLLKGEPLKKFMKIKRDVGSTVVLTSGVRSVAKQYQLFLTKAVETGGNLSQASRSLAPPGYSFHARGDFDLGKAGFGLGNFDESFCETDEYRRLIDLGYVAIRYTETNPFGVRHEPWHIKIA
ncbi:MAG: M15 family metallopeptidase [Thermoanaerobaculia bacterium]